MHVTSQESLNCKLVYKSRIYKLAASNYCHMLIKYMCKINSAFDVIVTAQNFTVKLIL